MEEIDLQHSFIKVWLKERKGEKNFNQAIIDAIEKSLGGLMDEELDEANLFKLLQEIKHGEKK